MVPVGLYGCWISTGLEAREDRADGSGMAVVSFDFGGHPRSSGMRAVVVLAIGGVLIVAALLASRMVEGGPAGVESTGLRPGEVMTVFSEPQGAADRVPLGAGLDKSSVQLDTTRLLGTTVLGTHYAAADLTGHMACLVTVPQAQSSVAEVSCTDLSGNDNNSALITMRTASRGSVALLRDESSLSSGWTRVGKNLAYAK
jgi:hypothetical protein